MFPGQKIEVLGSFFQITFVENPGMAFGVSLSTDIKLWVSLFSVAAVIGLILYLYKMRNKSFTLRLSLALILAGALGNLIDRMFYGVFYNYASLFYGQVVDFLDFDFWHFSLFGRSFDRWPVFNVADMAVSIGVFLLLVFYKKHNEETQNVNREAAVEPENQTDEERSEKSISSENDSDISEKNEDEKIS
jgi:signal peptidase II